MTNFNEKTLIEERNGIKIYFEALEEHEGLRADYWEEDVLKHTVEDLDSGKLTIFCAKMTAELNGEELSSDYLGQCIHENIEDFYTKYKTDYCQDMVNTVYNEAMEGMEDYLKELKENTAQVERILKNR